MSSEAQPQRGDYAVHIAWEGFGSIVHRASGEIMHSRTAPIEEARRVYVEQSHLADRLRVGTDELILWDVGLGAAANAVAAIECHEAIGPSARPLRIISFDTELDPLRLALEHPDRFPYLQREGPATLLRERIWRSAAITWEFIGGDFFAQLGHAPGPPEVIFYDMFSPKTCAPAWTAATFRALFSICEHAPTVLCTYTLSTASRAAMLAAGFWVARGGSAGHKEETTVVYSPAAARAESGAVWLGPDWLAKWNRSTARYPADVPEPERPAFEQAIRSHPQFHPRAPETKVAHAAPA